MSVSLALRRANHAQWKDACLSLAHCGAHNELIINLVEVEVGRWHFLVEIGYLIEGNGPSELSLTGQNATAKAATSRLYSVIVWYLASPPIFVSKVVNSVNVKTATAYHISFGRPPIWVLVTTKFIRHNDAELSDTTSFSNTSSDDFNRQRV
ncbi:hypothetical protein EVAR_32145_1 [Eumeta japonica]|uniref:Uncharacterized protein n=1 Tax=Eumeta variegata TaxID=151549 RepID=A0A4C1Z4N8_EUMVA|nr:hypothetical protein EVAR_32145_1 [Eumeta japonica]